MENNTDPDYDLDPANNTDPDNDLPDPDNVPDPQHCEIIKSHQKH